MQCREEAEDACGLQPRVFFVWHCGFFQDLGLETMKFAVFLCLLRKPGVARKRTKKEPNCVKESDVLLRCGKVRNKQSLYYYEYYKATDY